MLKASEFTGKNMNRISQPSNRFSCQAHGHTSTNSNERAVCVKCSGPHDFRICKKTLESHLTCVNCKGDDPENFYKYPALLAFLKRKKNRYIPIKSNHHNNLHASLPKLPSKTAYFSPTTHPARGTKHGDHLRKRQITKTAV